MDVGAFLLVLFVLPARALGQGYFDDVIIASEKGLENSPLAAPVDEVKAVLGNDKDPDIKRNVIEMIEARGYPCENHVVATCDGYILTLQRIPYGVKDPGNKKDAGKEVMLVLHGLTASADSYFLNVPTYRSLGFILPDAGYDVWFGNFRGGPYAKWTVNGTICEEKLYDYCLDQLASYDVPTMIDYVLKITGRKKLFLIGESLGSAVGFAMFASYPEYNEKVELFISLSPVAYVSNMLYTCRLSCILMSEIDKIINPMKLVPRSEFGFLVTQAVCNSVAKTFTCEKGFALMGAKPYYLDESRMGVIINHFPTDCSTRLLAHFGQWIKSEKFCKFDYGKEKNLMKYKQEEPPVYDLGAITVAVGLLSSTNDMLSAPKDVDRLRRELKNCVDDYVVPDENFNHLDFAAGYNAYQLVYPEVLNMCKRAIGRRQRR